MKHAVKVHKYATGFTLIELMITVAIIGILSAIAIPWYGDYIKRGRIPPAHNALSNSAIQLEQYFQDKGRYTTTSSSNVCGVPTPTDPYFSFILTCPAGGNTYTLTATGTGNMAGFVYTLDQTGAKATTQFYGGTLSGQNCWLIRKGSTC